MAVNGKNRRDDFSTISVLIAEDETALREELVSHLVALWPGVTVLASVDNGIDALTMFERYRPDLMFLDIQMPGLTGLEVAQQAADRCHIVFITAYDTYAVTAFESGAVDYVLKPYELGRLSQTLRRVQKRMATAPPDLSELLKEIAAAARPKTYLNWIKASHGTEVSLIMVRDICYFRADAKYTTVVTATQEYIIRRSIKELIAELDPGHFWQIHRSTIVNLDSVSSVARNMAGEMMLKLKSRPDRLAVSEAHRHLFKHM